MIPVFLIGGGWRVETFSQTYGRFLEAATENAKRRIVIVVAAEEAEAASNADEQFLRFRGAFEAVGLNSAEASGLIVSAAEPLTAEKLIAAEPTGIFVCGGLTPAYYDALCRHDKSWLDYLTENKIPYAGFSAGACVAAEYAIIGGWRRKINNRIVEAANENAGEDLDFLDVRKGLGLVSFVVDVHATQWGTLSRLVHAIDARLAPEGWAIDENTMLEIEENEVCIYGAGNAYYVRRENEKITVRVFQTV
ncbi:MAG TPA: Type 1 glutamine amidotransferase-like domain-containing protein [Pyrinomonadaceae bacterium]|nr:Type 1 glutamine amidotransferase-like domain-containing protein [Pyrinomonadaceae bacterium]